MGSEDLITASLGQDPGQLLGAVDGFAASSLRGMGLMDIVGGLMGRRSPRTGNPIMDALLPMLLAKGSIDGLGGLLGKFTGAGLGTKANSWVGSGGNDSLDPDEVEQALGTSEVDRIASEAGVSRDEAKSGLADMIPGLVDKMSPGGTLPTGNLATAMKGLDLGSIVGR